MYTDDDGKFEIELENLSPGGPFEMMICSEDGDRKKLSEVYVGDVFVCAGQSNMELPMQRVRERFPEEFQTGGCEEVHLYKVKECMEFSEELENHKQAEWMACVKENLEEVSAISYFLGKYLYEKHKIPIGIIDLSLGGTPIEAWMSREGIAHDSELLKIRRQYQNQSYRESILRKQEMEEKEWYENLERQRKNVGDLPWKEIKIPGYFLGQGLDNFCGALRLKKTFFADVEMAKEQAVLRFGTLVDSDKMYINGVKVGQTGYCFPPRRYEISKGVLKEGENELLIELICRDGKGRVTPGKKYEIVGESEQAISLDGIWKYQVTASCSPAPVQDFINRKPTGLFQGMVSPCLPYTVKGVVWYQGESNDSAPEKYRDLLQRMIKDWRKRWKQSRLPFVIVQLPNCAVDIAPGEAWPMIREAQKKAEQLPDVAVTVNLDLGEENDLHPTNKKGVAYRVFLAIEKLIYNENLVWCGPQLLGYEKQEKEIILQFETCDGKELCTIEDKEPEEFEIAGEDGQFIFVPAVLEKNQIRIVCDMVQEVKQVRYAWSEAPKNGLLCNQAGLLSSPFCIEI